MASRVIRVGDYHLVYYWFDRGGELPLHVHSTWDHETHFLSGRATILDGKHDDLTRLGGDPPVTFRAGVPHGFRADDGPIAFLNVTDLRQPGVPKDPVDA